MSIQVNNNASIDWSSLLNRLDAASKAVETQGAGGVTAGQSVTITANVDGAERTITFPVPDDLELPATVDQAGIDSLCAKLAGDQSLGLSENDVKAVHQALTDALAAAAPSVSGAAEGGSKSVMFDLYKLMALLVEVGQKQRDASREMRTAQNQQIQKSIQDQADRQKTAALTGMIAGAICCAVQVAVSIGMLGSQAKAFRKQVGTLESSGVASAKENLSMLKSADTAQSAQTQLDKVSADIGAKPSGHAGRTIATEIGERGFPESEQASARMQADKLALRSETQRLQRVANPDAPRQPGDVPPDSDLAKAEDNLARFDRHELLAGKENRTQNETRELLELREFDGKTREEFVKAVEDGRTQLVDEIRAKVESTSAKVESDAGAYRDAIKKDLGRYQDEYDAALRDANGITDKTPSAEAAKLRSDLQLASDKLKFARATAYQKLAQPGVSSPAQRAADIRLAGEAVDAAERGRMNDISFIKATRALQTGEAKLGIVNAIGNASQTFFQNLSGYIQAETKKSEAEQAKFQDELDQTKDLFQQAQSLVDAVVQLMQAVISAETQSMRDAIQA